MEGQFLEGLANEMKIARGALARTSRALLLAANSSRNVSLQLAARRGPFSVYLDEHQSR
jgi:hypothetical protein